MTTIITTSFTIVYAKVNETYNRPITDPVIILQIQQSQSSEVYKSANCFPAEGIIPIEDIHIVKYEKDLESTSNYLNWIAGNQKYSYEIQTIAKELQQDLFAIKNNYFNNRLKCSKQLIINYLKSAIQLNEKFIKLYNLLYIAPASTEKERAIFRDKIQRTQKSMTSKSAKIVSLRNELANRLRDR